ncbi:GHKL domain-containing protein [Streptococcus saliviloxodontae]|uniref:Two-component system sensor histidine kinase AgrC n=1 Tax=Streptococcus saliviloxodontae TaxID=1349416 RepID=A0ABS2PJ11_9STRE|nr:GHKL domain-containing protein [Streptococcus saliviloxodontae]MBM7635419.1 two-component system sensor histidine kinase AgrC [Streptococcus saliviloxodontae]
MAFYHYLLLFLFGIFIEFSILSIVYYTYVTLSNQKWSLKESVVIFILLFCLSFFLKDKMLIVHLMVFGGLSWWQNREKEWRYRLYYGFFSVLYVDLWSRFYALVLFTYLFSLSIEEVNKSLILYILSYLLVFPTYFISRSILPKANSTVDLYNPNDKRELHYLNIVLYGMLAYFLIVYLVPMILGEKYYFYLMGHVPLLASYRKTSVFLFALSTAWLLSYRDQFLKLQLRERLKQQYDERLQNLENYGKQLEVIYKSLSHFKLKSEGELKEFERILNQNDLDLANHCFDEILSDSHTFDRNYYSLTKLSHLQITSLKSYLASKIISGEEEGIEINVELPDLISSTPLTELELVRIVSIFWDNAIEATRLSDKPQLNFAFFEVDNQLMVIVENTTKEDQLDIGNIFDEGYSSKGNDRGVGLWTVQKILNAYPNISLITESKKNRFSQRLIMSLEEKNTILR